MTGKEKLLKIVDKLEAEQWETVSCEFNHNLAFFKKGYMTIQISFEECMCHGGRITICEKDHNGSYFRIEHETYDSEKGITDSETELLWEIENELIDVIKQFDHYTYKSCIINEYGQKNGRDDEVIRYHKNLDDAFYRLSKMNADPLTFTEAIHDYPSPVCHLKVKRISKDSSYSWDKNKIWFALEYTSDDWKTKQCYEGYISFFEKGD